MVAVDANILLRLIQIGHPHQNAAVESIAVLRQRDKEEFTTCVQALCEMYAICTRPLNAPIPGFGLTSGDAIERIEVAARQFPPVPDPPTLFNRWKELVVRYGVLGKASHDARLAAAIIERKIPRLLTFNDADFVRYTEIEVLNPFDVSGLPRI
ncbi:MAG TPA: hypothetical protein VGG19_08475 [Tepidisphaeraceae bacterium]|jgi:predicted nucleic acid-binding protein